MKSALVLTLGLGACAAPPQVEQPLVQWEEAQPEEGEALQALEHAVAAAYEREQAMAERVRQLETSNAQLRQALRVPPKPEPHPKCAAGFFTQPRDAAARRR